MIRYTLYIWALLLSILFNVFFRLSTPTFTCLISYPILFYIAHTLSSYHPYCCAESFFLTTSLPHSPPYLSVYFYLLHICFWPSHTLTHTQTLTPYIPPLSEFWVPLTHHHPSTFYLLPSHFYPPHSSPSSHWSKSLAPILTSKLSYPPIFHPLMFWKSTKTCLISYLPLSNSTSPSL